MERIGCGILPPAGVNGNTFSIDNDFHNFTTADYINCGTAAYINLSINCKSKSVVEGKHAGMAMSSKGIHKFVERKRRRDMKTLFFALRSLMPEEYVQEKCSTAEQLSVTANYINHLHEKIKNLTQRREEMRKDKLCRNLSFSVPSETCPIVKMSCHDWGVLVTTNTPKHQIVLSDLLLVLANNGLDVVTAVACAMNDKVFHTIHAKVGEHNSFDNKTLYQSICNLVSEKTSDVKGSALIDFCVDNFMGFTREDC